MPSLAEIWALSTALQRMHAKPVGAKRSQEPSHARSSRSPSRRSRTPRSSISLADKAKQRGLTIQCFGDGHHGAFSASPSSSAGLSQVTLDQLCVTDEEECTQGSTNVRVSKNKATRLCRTGVTSEREGVELLAKAAGSTASKPQARIIMRFGGSKVIAMSDGVKLASGSF
eukprot:6486494-Amphidinium_carterae.1